MKYAQAWEDLKQMIVDGIYLEPGTREAIMEYIDYLEEYYE